jgi:hypothetical protein
VLARIRSRCQITDDPNLAPSRRRQVVWMRPLESSLESSLAQKAAEAEQRGAQQREAAPAEPAATDPNPPTTPKKDPTVV